MSSIAEEQTAGQRNKRHPFGLLAGIVMVTVIVMVAFFTSVYIYNHPTSSISLFFIEVSHSSPPSSSFVKDVYKVTFIYLHCAI